MLTAKRRRRRKRWHPRQKALAFFFVFVFVASLLIYWVVDTMSDPVYYNYEIQLPQPLSELTFHNYDFQYLRNDTPYHSYEDETYQAVPGIDVSGHNGDIDWEKVYQSGIRFAYLRVGFRGYGKEGNIVKDEKFEEYYRQAKKAGLSIGVYFFSQAISHQEAMEEAFFTLEAIRRKEITLPVAYDLEDIDYDHSRIDGVSRKKRTENALVFAQKIQENGKTCFIYGNKHWLTEVYDPSYILHHPVWFAQYAPLPALPYHFSMWQYSDKGKVPGIAVDTDLNLLFLRKNDIK